MNTLRYDRFPGAPSRRPGHCFHTPQQNRTDCALLHAITYTGPTGTFRQAAELTKPQREFLSAWELAPSKKIIELSTGR